ncbi:glycosyltransferase [Rhodovibrio sodomensis]|uniref:glycosyltransferase n=1 Tax=Rhodovibrio sodomensis TaxID=1088 RepID=UPI0019067656|nr:glycosyltransferase [Rhodovibrio sodomensis]
MFGPKHLALAGYIDYDLLVYHAYDKFSNASREGESFSDNREKELLAVADLVLASSDPIADGLRQQGRRDVRVLPNGVDYTAYNTPSGQEPRDICHIPRPRVGYFGRVNIKVDLALIDELAEVEPKFQWIIVGEIYEQVIHSKGYGELLERLKSRPNVHLLGYRPHTSIPAYVQAMDVLSMVYRQGEQDWWSAGYPLKMHEYLATGKPVISTPLQTVQPFGHVIDIRDGGDEWIAGLRKAVNSGGVGTSDMRRRVALENTWDQRIDLLERWLNELGASLEGPVQ